MTPAKLVLVALGMSGLSACCCGGAPRTGPSPLVVPGISDATPRLEVIVVVEPAAGQAAVKLSVFPAANTCDGANTPPLVSWDRAPLSARQYVLEMVDTDVTAGPFTHWLLYGISTEVRRSSDALDTGGLAGGNDFGGTGYGGPCPPAGPPHHYHVLVVALDRTNSAPPGRDRAAIEGLFPGHVVAAGETILTYQRR